MDLLTALKILFRQWLVVLLGLVLTVLGVIQVGASIQPNYQAKGTVLLLGPGRENNPYLEFGANLEVMADALVAVLQSPAGVEKLAAQGATGDYKLERAEGPIVDITADGHSKDEADRTAELVAEAMQKELSTAQEAAPAQPRVSLDVLTVPEAEVKYGSRIRAQVAVLAIGLVATVAAALCVDALRRRRQDVDAEAVPHPQVVPAAGGPPAGGRVGPAPYVTRAAPGGPGGPPVRSYPAASISPGARRAPSPVPPRGAGPGERPAPGDWPASGDRPPTKEWSSDDWPPANGEATRNGRSPAGGPRTGRR